MGFDSTRQGQNSGLRYERQTDMTDDVTVSESGSLTREDLTRVSFYAILSGSTSLIPIPVVDDWIYGLIRRRMARDLFRRTGWELSSDQARWLTARPSLLEGKGCMQAALIVLVFWPARVLIYVFSKLFRKVFFIFAVKEAVDRTSEAFHEGFYLAYGSARCSGRGRGSARRVGLLRAAVRETVRGLDTSPVRNVFRGVLRLNQKVVSKAAALLRSAWGGLRRGGSRGEAESVLEREETLLGEIAEETAGILMGEQGYLNNLYRRFDQSAERLGLFRQDSRRTVGLEDTDLS